MGSSSLVLLAWSDVLAASLFVLLAVEDGTTEDRMFADGRAVKPSQVAISAAEK